MCIWNKHRAWNKSIIKHLVFIASAGEGPWEGQSYHFLGFSNVMWLSFCKPGSWKRKAVRVRIKNNTDFSCFLSLVFVLKCRGNSSWKDWVCYMLGCIMAMKLKRLRLSSLTLSVDREMGCWFISGSFQITQGIDMDGVPTYGGFTCYPSGSTFRVRQETKPELDPNTLKWYQSVFVRMPNT